MFSFDLKGLDFIGSHTSPSLLDVLQNQQVLPPLSTRAIEDLKYFLNNNPSFVGNVSPHFVINNIFFINFL